MSAHDLIHLAEVFVYLCGFLLGFTLFLPSLFKHTFSIISILPLMTFGVGLYPWVFCLTLSLSAAAFLKHLMWAYL